MTRLTLPFRARRPATRTTGRRTPTLRGLAVSLTLLLLATACGQTLVGPGVAVTVNGQTIPIEDVEALVLDAVGAVDPQTGQPVSESDVTTQAVGELAAVEALDQELVERGGESVDQAAIDASLDEAAELAGGDEAFQAQLDQQGVTPAQLQLQQRIALVIEGLNQILSTDLDVAEDEVQAAYETQFGQPTVSHILVETEPEAEDVLARLDGGEDFGAVAQDMSLDPGSAANGGDLGPLQIGAFVPEFEEAALALQPGEISAPVETQFGFHVITTNDPEPLTDELRAEIEAQLRDQAGQQQFAGLLEEVLLAADVDVNPRFGRWDPQVTPQGLSQIIATGSPLGALTPVGGDAAAPVLPTDELPVPPAGE